MTLKPGMNLGGSVTLVKTPHSTDFEGGQEVKTKCDLKLELLKQSQKVF